MVNVQETPMKTLLGLISVVSMLVSCSKYKESQSKFYVDLKDYEKERSGGSSKSTSERTFTMERDGFEAHTDDESKSDSRNK